MKIKKSKKKPLSQKKSVVKPNLLQISIIAVSLVLVGSVLSFINSNRSVKRAEMATVCPQIAISAYFGTNLWAQAITYAPTVHIMKANNANGPGGLNSSLLTAINNAKSKGIRVLGYVSTSYTAKSSATVKADVDLWRTEYNVTDIFFDTASNKASDIPYYQDLANYVHTTTPGSIVALNPGTFTDEGYAAFADLIEITENTYANYVNLTMPAWISKYPATKFMNVIHTTPDVASMQNAVALAKQRNIGYIYVTDDVESNPYDTLPTFIAQEVAAVNAGCTKVSGTPVAPAPSGVVPSFVCAGGINCAPSASVTQPQTSSAPASGGTTNTAVSSAPAPSGVTTTDPCAGGVQYTNRNKGNKHKLSSSSNSFIQMLLQFLTQILNLILQLFGGSTANTAPTASTNITPSTVPCVSQTP